MTSRLCRLAAIAAAALAALLCAAAGLGASPREPAGIALSVEARVPGREGEGLAGTLARVLGDALATDYGGWLRVVPAGPSVPAARVTVGGVVGSWTARTVLSPRSGASRSLTSVVPELRLLVAAVAGDLLALWAGDSPSAVFPLADPGPALVLTVPTSALGVVIGPGRDTAVADLAYGPEGLVLAVAGGSVVLDSLLRVVPETARDIAAIRGKTGTPAARLQAPLTGIRLALRADLGTLDLSDPRTRESWSVSPAGGPFAGLAAMPWGGFALWRRAPSAPALEVTTGQRAGELTVLREFTVAPAFATAVAADYDGNVWIYDAAAGRIRIFDAVGREVHGIRPLVEATIGIPQGLAVYPDGSFLLAGGGEVWKCDRAGTPVWRLRALGAGSRRAMPQSFRFALHGATGAFSLLDPEAGEIHLFTDPSVTTAGSLESEIIRHRAASSAADFASFCMDNDLVVVASGALGPAGSGEGYATAGARRRLDRLAREDVARASADYASRLAGALDLDGAEPLYADAIDVYRALRAAYPADEGYQAALDALTTRRSLLRDARVGLLDAEIRARAPILHPAAPAHLALRLAPASGRSSPPHLRGVVVEMGSASGLRGVTRSVGDLTAEQELRIPLDLAADAGMAEEDRPLVLGLRLSGTVGEEVVSRVLSVAATLAGRSRFDEGWYAGTPDQGSSSSRASYLAWLAATPDPCLARLRDVAGLAAGPPIAAAAAVFALLADVFTVEPDLDASGTQSPRRAAHAGHGTGRDALVLAAALLTGVERYILTIGGSCYLVIDTGLPLAGRGEAGRVTGVLSAMATRGTALLPLAEPAPGEGATALEAAARRALAEIDAAGTAGARLVRVAAPGAPVRSPFLPVAVLPLPDLAARASRDAAAAEALLGAAP